MADQKNEKKRKAAELCKDGRFEDTLTLEKLRSKVAAFADERDWNQFHTPRNLLLALVGEVGELSEIFQWRGEVEPGLNSWKEEDKIHLGEELSDVLVYLVRLSDNVDRLATAVQEKMNATRGKYPADLAREQQKIYRLRPGLIGSKTLSLRGPTGIRLNTLCPLKHDMKPSILLENIALTQKY